VKFKALALAVVMGFSLLAGCAAKEAPKTEPTKVEVVDAVTSASVVTDAASLQKAASSDGTWIVIFIEDMTVDTEIVLEGAFTNKDLPARKIALYAQDENRKKTAVYTLTAPKLTVKSENARIQGGTFVGDVYVEANGFSVVDAEIKGNVYFANEDVKSTFTLDQGTVTGATEVK
jgi:hypothetical protein